MKLVWTWLVLVSALVGRAQTVTLAWDASPSPEVTSYRIYFGTNAGNYSFVTNAGLVLTQTVVVPHSGRWFFAATAVDANGLESDFSNMVQWEARPVTPIVKGEPWFRLWPELWQSTNQVDWVSFKGEATWIAATNAAEFFTMRGLLIERVQRVNEP
ncbi:MAG: hypothetical protein V9H26_16455 [Verrucomicrobiota bacterium]